MKKLIKYAFLALSIIGFGLNNSAQAIDARSAACCFVASAAVGGLTALYAKKFGQWLYKNPQTMLMAALGFATELIPAQNECIHSVAGSAAALTCGVAVVQSKSYFTAAATTLIPYLVGSELARQISS
ncbi:MAG: hypothetical protein BWY54_00179 [Candidatus Dependentiae bacterium ADurb.Bin331]|nr:MAG: hypothetical protein BWY54_00179 [Candidatus Dependentiae bacterium ADurb.Bin331]